MAMRTYRHIKIAVEPEEWAELNNSAILQGLKLSGYCRKLLNIRNDIDKKKDKKMNLALISALNKIGSNLNQIAKYVNTKKELDQQVLIKLFEIQEEIKTLRGTL
jgi:hypothetical protein